MSTKKPRTIPQFSSMEEEAEFWDTHDTADFEDEFRPIEAKFAKNLTQGITIRLDPETLRDMRLRAKAKGIGPTTLARMWILERMQEEDRRTSRKR